MTEVGNADMPRAITCEGSVHEAKTMAEHINILIIGLCLSWLRVVRDPVVIHLFLRCGLGEALCQEGEILSGLLYEPDCCMAHTNVYPHMVLEDDQVI